MSHWLSPSIIEFTLLILKVAGVVGAFYGFSLETTSTAEGRRSRRVWAFCFLGLAISAELCDSLLKRLDAKEQAVRWNEQTTRWNEETIRFERLTHPMGTIRVVPEFSFMLTGEQLNEYEKRLGKKEGLVVALPNPKTEPRAYALFNARLELAIFLTRESFKEPGLMFEIPFEENRIAKPLAPGNPIQREKEVDQKRGYYYFPWFHAFNTGFATFSNGSEDRYSDGSIISTADLPGSELTVRFCSHVSYPLPATQEEAGDDLFFLGVHDRAVEKDLRQHIKLESVLIEFPGRQKIELNPGTNGVQASIFGNFDCQYLEYRFPKDPKQFKKALTPAY